jgi:hypothetical protein
MKWTPVIGMRYSVVYRRKGHGTKQFVGVFVKRNAFGDLVFTIQPLMYTPICVAEKEIRFMAHSTGILCKPS